MFRGSLVCLVVLACVLACAMARPGGRRGGRRGGRPERPGNPQEQEGRPSGGRPGGRHHRAGPRPVLCYLSIDGNVTLDEPCAFQGELFECVEGRRPHRPAPHSSEEDSEFDFDESDESDEFDFGDSDSDESDESFESESEEQWQSVEDDDEFDRTNITAKFCRPLNCTADSDCSGDNMCLAPPRGHHGGPRGGRHGGRRGGRRGGRPGNRQEDGSEQNAFPRPSGGRCEITCAQQVYAGSCLLTDDTGAVVRNVSCPPHLTCNTEHGRTFLYQAATLTAHMCQKTGEFDFPAFDRCAGLKTQNTTVPSLG